jgi:hypothetical protein
LICGFTPEGQTALDDVIVAAAIRELPLVYAGSDDLEMPLAEIIARKGQAGRGEPSRMPAAIIMAGITEKELHQLISSYRDAAMPAPLWATLTPTSETWTLRQLLKELSAERAALANQPPARSPEK